MIPTPENIPGRVSSTGPRACYDESKRYGETLCVNFARQYELPITMVRPFNNYGPGLRLSDQRVIPDLARDVLAGRDMVLYSDGSATRTFCYIADAIVGYYKVLVHGRRGEAYNVGNERPEISIDELASIMSSIARDTFGYSGRVVRHRSADEHYLTDNPRRRCPDISKAREELAFLAEGSAGGRSPPQPVVVSRQSGGYGAMNIAIVGAGYVGLVSGLCLADTGHTCYLRGCRPRPDCAAQAWGSASSRAWPRRPSAPLPWVNVLSVGGPGRRRPRFRHHDDYRRNAAGERRDQPSVHRRRCSRNWQVPARASTAITSSS